MTRCARNMFDGRGPDRIVNGMEIILHTPARHRAATAMPATLPFRAAACDVENQPAVGRPIPIGRSSARPARRDPSANPPVLTIPVWRSPGRFGILRSPRSREDP